MIKLLASRNTPSLIVPLIILLHACVTNDIPSPLAARHKRHTPQTTSGTPSQTGHLTAIEAETKHGSDLSSIGGSSGLSTPTRSNTPTPQFIPQLPGRGPSILPLFRKLRQGDITSTTELVEALSDPDVKTKDALIRLLKAYNIFFSKLDMTQPESEEINEYSTLARVALCPQEQLTAGQKASQRKLKSQLKTYVEVWRKKVEEGFRIEDFTPGVVEFLKHIDVQAFGQDTTLLRKLSQSLLQQLPDSADAYTADQYASHRDILNAIEQALIKIRAISGDKLDPKEGFYKSFKERIDKIMGSKYYPIAYQARCIAQNLVRMEQQPESWEKAQKAGYRAYYAFKGVVQVMQNVVGAALLDLDFEDFESGLVNITAAIMGHTDADTVDGGIQNIQGILKKKKYKTEPWYEHTQELLLAATACLLPQAAFEKAKKERKKGFAAYKDYSAYQKQRFAHYKTKADALVKKTKKKHLATLQYGIVQQLTLLATQAKSREVRQACTNELVAKLKDIAWHQEQGVMEALLSSLNAIHHTNGDDGHTAEEALQKLHQRAIALAHQEELQKETPVANKSWFHKFLLLCYGSQSAPPSPASIYPTWKQQQQRSAVHLATDTRKLFEKVKRYVARNEDVREAEAAKKATAEAERHHKIMEERRKAQKLPAPAAIPFFVGREDIIQKITSALQQKQKENKPLLTHLLCGPGGIGKSQLAIQLFNALEKTGQYDHVFWLPAETPEQLSAEYLRIADRLGIAIDKRNTQNAIRDIRDALASKHCLWVFDGVPNGKTIQDLMPQQGHVLLTSRNSKQSDWGSTVHHCPLKQLSKDDLVALATKFKIKELDAATIKYLLGELSGYPVIVAQFFSLCQSEGQAPAAFRKELQKNGGLSAEEEAGLNELLEETPEQRVVYNKSMVQVLSKNLSALQKSEDEKRAEDGKRALSLLSRFAHLDPKGIPIAWIEQLDEGVNKRKVRQALGLLEKYSLAQWDREAGQVYIHAVTQHIVRHYRPCHELAELATRLIQYAGDEQDAHQHPEKWATVLQHGQRLAKSLPKEENESKYELARALGKACEIAHLYDRALAWYQQSLSIATTLALADEDNGHKVASSRHSIGEIRYSQGKYEQALKSYREALNGFQAYDNKPHPAIASCHLSLGNVHSERGDYEEALKSYEKALNMLLEIHKDDKDHPDLASCYHNIGRLHLDLGDYPQALANSKEALRIEQTIHGNHKPHPAIASSHHNIGDIYDSQGKHTEARENYEKALQVFLEIYKDKPHPDVAMSYLSLGNVDGIQGNNLEAQKNYEKALQMFLEIYKDKPHPDVATSHLCLGIVHSNQEEYDKALEHYREALRMYEKAYGTKPHPEVASCHNNIGDVYASQEQYRKALDSYNTARKMFEEVYDNEPHPNVATILSNLGDLYRKQGKYKEASPYYQQAWNIRKECLGADHPDTQRSQQNAADMRKELAQQQVAAAR